VEIKSGQQKSNFISIEDQDEFHQNEASDDQTTQGEISVSQQV